MRLLRYILRIAFHLLYHSFAWAYDWVADLVSLGRWKEWVKTVLPYIRGNLVLELGHGPGHLQRFLLERSLIPFGLDESAPMGRLARRNLHRFGYTQTRLARGLAQAIPFPSAAFETVVATFPSEYIFDPLTLAEVRRVLIPNGRLIVLPTAWPFGNFPSERLLGRLLRFIFQGDAPLQETNSRLRSPFEQAGFNVQVEILKYHSSRVFLLLADTPPNSI